MLYDGVFIREVTAGGPYGKRGLRRSVFTSVQRIRAVRLANTLGTSVAVNVSGEPARPVNVAVSVLFVPAVAPSVSRRPAWS